MSQLWEPWSDNPNAPQIPYILYFAEKTLVVGNAISAVLYGIVVVLFFKCMGALFNSFNRTKGDIKWVLVAHTMAMFLCATINTAPGFELLSVAYIENREFPGNDELGPGPYEYQVLIYSDPASIATNITFYLGQWLADGLLLYRCCVIFAMNYWFIVFPCTLYLASVAMGALCIYQLVRKDRDPLYSTFGFDIGVSYYSIALALNVILTFMIITKLVLHSKNIQNALGGQAGASRSYRTINTILTESFALYAVNFVLFIGPWAAGHPISAVFFGMLPMTQVIAPFLIIIRVANQSALTSKTIASGNMSSIEFGSRGEVISGSESVSEREPMGSTDVHDETLDDSGAAAENTIEEAPI